MIFEFERMSGQFYAINAEGKTYGLVEATLTDMKVHVYLLDENENILYEVLRPYSMILKSFGVGVDEVKNMHEELANSAKALNVDFSETFKKIREKQKDRRGT
jgi:NAD(P)H-nitrite reductase large subunit